MKKFKLLRDADFPCEGPAWIPMAIAEQAYDAYVLRGCGGLSGQSFDKIIARGGFSATEIDQLLAGVYPNGWEGGQPDEPFERASGKMVCARCGLYYWRHPYSPYYLSFDGRPYLTRLCAGRLVKL